MQKAKQEANCPCCGRFARIYRRRFNSTMARQLVEFYRIGGADKFIHTSEIVVRCSSGDFTKAKFWGLIYQSDEPPIKGASTNGKWRLTQYGVDFVKGRKCIQETAVILFDRKVAAEGKLVTIQECLSAKGFNYNELMGV